jgi:hypothetical protein
MDKGFGTIPKKVVQEKKKMRSPGFIEESLLLMANHDKLTEIFARNVDDTAKDVSEQKANIRLYLIILQALAENKTIREICEQYCVKEVSEGPQMNFYEKPIMEKLEYSGYLKLVKRDKPIEISNEKWHDFVSEMMLRLQKKLEIKY